MKTKEQINQLIQEIGSLGSVEEIRAGLGNLQQELEADYEEVDGIIEERDGLLERNTRLEKANNDLFLQIGSKKEPEKKQEPENLKFENLFNEKGEIR